MPNYTMDDVKKLRKLTEARVMDCKKALDEAKGDMKKAQQIVAAKGLARAEKKADRQTQNGFIGDYVHSNGLIAAMVEIDCETDFVAQNKELREMTRNIAMHVVAMDPKNVKELLDQDYVRDPEITIATLIKTLSGKIGEKMVLKRFVRYMVGE
jgi:elongation factor Ts